LGSKKIIMTMLNYLSNIPLAELLEYSDTRVQNKAHEALIILVGKDYGNTTADWINMDQ